MAGKYGRPGAKLLGSFAGAALKILGLLLFTAVMLVVIEHLAHPNHGLGQYESPRAMSR